MSILFFFFSPSLPSQFLCQLCGAAYTVIAFAEDSARIHAFEFPADRGAAPLTERLVQPGRRTVLSVTIPDGTLLGRAEVKLTTNDPQEPYKTFVVKPFDSR